MFGFFHFRSLYSNNFRCAIFAYLFICGRRFNSLFFSILNSSRYSHCCRRNSISKNFWNYARPVHLNAWKIISVGINRGQKQHTKNRRTWNVMKRRGRTLTIGHPPNGKNAQSGREARGKTVSIRNDQNYHIERKECRLSHEVNSILWFSEDVQ